MTGMLFRIGQILRLVIRGSILFSVISSGYSVYTIYSVPDYKNYTDVRNQMSPVPPVEILSFGIIDLCSGAQATANKEPRNEVPIPDALGVVIGGCTLTEETPGE